MRRTSWIALLVTMTITACNGMPPPRDGATSTPPTGCPALQERAAFDFFGEPCISDPYPVNTTCHDGDTGWCIGIVCRPMSSLGPDGHCPSCPDGTERFAPAGAGYCAP